MKSRYEDDFDRNEHDNELWTLSNHGNSERFGQLLGRARSGGGMASDAGAPAARGDENLPGKADPRRREPLDAFAARACAGRFRGIDQAERNPATREIQCKRQSCRACSND